jgi:hypothetical protein
MSDEKPPPKKCKVCSQIATRPTPNYGFCTEGCRNEKKNTKSYVKIADRPGGVCCLFMHGLSCLYTKSDTRYTGAASQSTAAVRSSNISASTSTSAASSPRCQGESRGPKVKAGDTKNVVLRCRWNSTSKKWISLGSGGSATCHIQQH